MRKQFETKEDRTNEQLVADIFGEAWNVDLHKLPNSHRLDYLGERDGVGVCWIEVKVRTIAHDRYDTFSLSVLKWWDMGSLRAATNLPAVLAVQWSDGWVGWMEWRPDKNYVIRQGGRTVKTRDAADHHPVILIPIKDFRFVKPKPVEIPKPKPAPKLELTLMKGEPMPEGIDIDLFL